MKWGKVEKPVDIFGRAKVDTSPTMSDLTRLRTNDDVVQSVETIAADSRKTLAVRWSNNI